MVQALQEISVEDRKRRLSNSKADVLATEKRIKTISKDLEDMDKKVQEAVKKEKHLKTELEKWRNKVTYILLHLLINYDCLFTYLKIVIGKRSSR